MTDSIRKICLPELYIWFQKAASYTRKKHRAEALGDMASALALSPSCCVTEDESRSCSVSQFPIK